MVVKSIVGDEETPLLCEVDAARKPNVEKDADIQTQVYAVYAVAVLMVLIMTAARPPILLYLESVGYASANDVSFYFICTVISSITPVVGNFVFGFMTSSIGAACALTVNCITLCIGLVGMTMAQSKQTFAIMHALQGTLMCTSMLRMSLLAKIVPRHKRTEALMYHNIAVIGGIVGPMVWLLCSKYSGEVNLGFTVLNMFTLNFLICAGCAFLMAFISYNFLVGKEEIIDPDSQQIDNTVPVSRTRPSKHQLFLLLYFSTIMICEQFVSSLGREAAQPILVNHFGVNGSQIAIIFEVVVLAAAVPTLGTAILSRVLKDRHILCGALWMQLFSVLFYLPWWGPVSLFQFIFGFALMAASSILISTSAISLFSKLLLSTETGAFIGVLSAISGLSYALPQLFLGETAVKMFNTPYFAIFAVPTMLAITLVLWPRNRDMLDSTAS